MLLLAVAASASTCDQQDFILLDPPLYISKVDGELASLQVEGPIVKHDLLARHTLDFRLHNPSDRRIEVVVWAQSAIAEDDAVRVTAERDEVFVLEAGETTSDRFSELDLKVGTQLRVQLQCCEASACNAGEVICPSSIPCCATDLSICCEDADCDVNTLNCPVTDGQSVDTTDVCLVEQPDACISSCYNEISGLYDALCLSTCFTEYSRCCGALTEDTPIPCCLEPCDVRRCTAGELARELFDAKALAVETNTPLQRPEFCPDPSVSPNGCATFPLICYDGCLDSSGEHDARCLVACMSLFELCCGADTPSIPADTQIPCCFEEGCVEASCAQSTFVCDESDVCDHPEVCIDACEIVVDKEKAFDPTCAAACVQRYRECCEDSREFTFATANVPCCYGGCDVQGQACPADDPGCSAGCLAEDVDCASDFTCNGYPYTCVSACQSASDLPPEISCVVSCMEKYDDCCVELLDIEELFDPSLGLRLFTDLGADVPCCYETACEAELTAVVKLDSIECRSSSDCGTSEACNDRGLCESSAQDTEESCQVHDLNRPRSTPWTALACALLGLFLLHARRSGRRRAARTAGLLITFLLLLASPDRADADEPLGFQRTHSSLSLGFHVADFLGDDFGEHAGFGFGVTLQEVIQRSYFGFVARITFAVHGSSQPPLPFDHSFEAYHIATGFRGIIPVSRDLLVITQVEYVLMGLGSNALIEVSEGRSILHGVGLSNGVQYMLSEMLIVEAVINADYFPQVNTVMLGGVLSFGLQGIL